jgi:hypothetical protein
MRLSVTIGPGRQAVQQVVEGEDLRPVGVLGARRLVVHGGDRGLHLKRAHRERRQRVADERHALGDGAAVPEAAVLLGERDERAVGRRPGRAARVGEQHQREQAGDLAVSRQPLAQLAGEPDRLAGGARRGAAPGLSWPCTPR